MGPLTKARRAFAHGLQYGTATSRRLCGGGSEEAGRHRRAWRPQDSERRGVDVFGNCVFSLHAVNGMRAVLGACLRTTELPKELFTPPVLGSGLM